MSRQKLEPAKLPSLMKTRHLTHLISQHQRKRPGIWTRQLSQSGLWKDLAFSAPERLGRLRIMPVIQLNTTYE